jgi:O-antigen ligase
MMKEIAPHVESQRDHLHSNPVQILVATGCVGLALYLAWMAAAVSDGVRFCRAAAREGGTDQMVAAALLLMLAALLLNGIVEYNFGDGELVLFYGFLMGALAAGRRPASPSSGTSSDRFVLPG